MKKGVTPKPLANKNDDSKVASTASKELGSIGPVSNIERLNNESKKSGSDNEIFTQTEVFSHAHATASLENLYRIFTVPEAPDSTLGSIDK